MIYRYDIYPTQPRLALVTPGTPRLCLSVEAELYAAVCAAVTPYGPRA